MTQCSEHVTFQLPDERSRVRHLLDSIITTDVLLLAAIANLDIGDKGVINDFKKSSDHLLMHGPATKRKSASGIANKDNLYHVLEANASASLSVSVKASKGKTSVEFRHYKRVDFMILSKEQRDELDEFRKKYQGDDDSGKSRKKAMFDKFNKDSINISSLIQSEFEKRANNEKWMPLSYPHMWRNC